MLDTNLQSLKFPDLHSWILPLAGMLSEMHQSESISAREFSPFQILEDVVKEMAKLHKSASTRVCSFRIVFGQLRDEPTDGESSL